MAISFGSPLGNIIFALIMVIIYYVVFGMDRNVFKQGVLRKHTVKEALEKGREYDQSLWKKFTDQATCEKCGAGPEYITFRPYQGFFMPFMAKSRNAGMSGSTLKVLYESGTII